MTESATDHLVEPYRPVVLDDVFMAFPAHVNHLMPARNAIPADFRAGDTPWNRIVSSWFFHGLPADVEFYPKDGIDPAVAVRHLQAIMGSYQPKHEHKEAAVAYLLSCWFERVKKWEQK
jgi:hypothetical protein